MRARVAAAIAVVCVTACGGTSPTGSASPTVSTTPTPFPSSSALPSASSRFNPLQACAAKMLIPEMEGNHNLILVWLTGDTSHTLVRDITDVRHPVNLCSLDLLAAGYPKSGPIRFATFATVTVSAPDLLYVLDIMSGLWSPLANGSTTGHLDEYDVATDGMSCAYVLFTDDGKTAEYHLNVRTSASSDDRLLTTVQNQSGFSGSDVHVEFSPSGRSVAFGATGVTGANDKAAVQVWSLDRHLLFSASGTNGLTWAGAGDRLYYDDGANLSRWDGSGNTTAVAMTGRWTKPSAATDRHYVAFYSDALSTIAILNTTDGAVKRLTGTNTTPAFLTTTLLYHRYSLHPIVGLGQSRIYDMADSTDTVSSIDHVFSTWPRATPTYGSD